MIEAWYHDSVNALDRACQPDRLASPHSPFERREWFALLAETGLAPLFAGASHQDQDAILALTESAGHITPLRNWYSFTWRPLVPEGAAAKPLLTGIAASLRNRAHRVTLEPVPDEQGSARQLVQAFRSAGWSVSIEPCDVNHYFEVQGRSFAEYWADRPGQLRTTLKRKAKKVEVSLLTSFDEAAWGDYERIYAQSWKPAEDQPAMLRAFAQEEGAAGRLRLALAYHEGSAIAAQFWTVEDGVAYIHKLAHLEEHKRLSAGTTLSAALFEHVIDLDRVELVDFGTGDEPYKRDWMEQVRPRFRIDCLNPRNPRAWPALAKRSIRWLATQSPQS